MVPQKYKMSYKDVWEKKKLKAPLIQRKDLLMQKYGGKLLW
jgi:hypothetical protein